MLSRVDFKALYLESPPQDIHIFNPAQPHVHPTGESPYDISILCDFVAMVASSVHRTVCCAVAKSACVTVHPTGEGVYDVSYLTSAVIFAFLVLVTFNL